MVIHILKIPLCLLLEVEPQAVVKVGAVSRLVVVPVTKPYLEAILLCHWAQWAVEHMVLLQPGHRADIVLEPTNVALPPGLHDRLRHRSCHAPQAYDRYQRMTKFYMA